MVTRSHVLALLTGALLLSVSQAGASPLSVSGSVGGAPGGASNYLNFDGLTVGDTSTVNLGGATISFTPDAAPVQGASSGVYAAPYLSGSNGNGFGNSGVPGVDQSVYVTTGSTGNYGAASVTLAFAVPEKYLGLLWGSVDSYNTLAFYDASTTLIGTVTGADVLASPDGNQGINGTLYANINSTAAFSYIVATSSQYAFEFDNVAFNSSPLGAGATPLPAAIWLMGTVLGGGAGFGAWRKKRKNTAAAVAA